MAENVNKLLLQNDKKLVIIGAVGNSAFPDCNKMVALNLLDRHPALLDHEAEEGQIQFYYNPAESILWLHFETTFDATSELHQRMRSRFARIFLFATHMCHLIVFVELNVTFDASLLGTFKALKIIRQIIITVVILVVLLSTQKEYNKQEIKNLWSSFVLIQFVKLF
uniref:Uncharacterized protein n=1 Tax=Glossina pallidipes TaxID=7398 RepID=A0A1B0AJM4_GLOPL